MASRSWKNTVYTKECRVGDNAKQGHQPVLVRPLLTACSSLIAIHLQTRLLNF